MTRRRWTLADYIGFALMAGGGGFLAVLFLHTWAEVPVS